MLFRSDRSAKVEKAWLSSPAPNGIERPCEARNGGHGGSRRPATAPQGADVTAAKAGGSVGPPGTNRPKKGRRGKSGYRRRQWRLKTAWRESTEHQGAGPRSQEPWGNSRQSATDPRNRVRESEIPRPSSRETAMPPRWVCDRGKKCRDQPSVQKDSPLTFCAERTEAGPGPRSTCLTESVRCRNAVCLRACYKSGQPL